MKRLLREDRAEEVVDQAPVLFKGRGSKKRRKLFTYFKERADKMRYGTYRKKGIPLGSGAVESCVRRVVNLRLKGNGIFWKLETAEGVLHLRAQLLCGRWDHFIQTILTPREGWTMGDPNAYQTLRQEARYALEKRARRFQKPSPEEGSKAA